MGDVVSEAYQVEGWGRNPIREAISRIGAVLAIPAAMIAAILPTLTP